MTIIELKPQPDWKLLVVTDDKRTGIFDLFPYLECEAFTALKDAAAFMRVHNRGYYIEWDCGADLSADTIEAKMMVLD